MKALTKDQLEQLGSLIDKADNYLALVKISSVLHVDALQHGLTEIRTGMHDLYVAIAKDDPWAAEKE